MGGQTASAPPSLSLTQAGRELVWRQWDDHYIVYQPSSAETHVFNETTALILESLEQGPLSMNGIAAWIDETLGIESHESTAGELGFAVNRLEEIGLIELSDDFHQRP